MTFSMIISTFVSGVLGSMGFGGGTVFIVYLTYFCNMPQKEAQGINLICYIPVAIIAVTTYTKQKLTDKNVIIPLIIYGIIGAVSGFLLLEILSGDILRKLFGVFLIVLSLKEFFQKKENKNTKS